MDFELWGVLGQWGVFARASSMLRLDFPFLFASHSRIAWGTPRRSLSYNASFTLPSRHPSAATAGPPASYVMLLSLPPPTPSRSQVAEARAEAEAAHANAARALEELREHMRAGDPG